MSSSRLTTSASGGTPASSAIPAATLGSHSRATPANPAAPETSPASQPGAIPASSAIHAASPGSQPHAASPSSTAPQSAPTTAISAAPETNPASQPGATSGARSNLQPSATPAASVNHQPGATPAANAPLRVIITGTTGMVGEGVLHECLRHPAVEAVLILNRKPLGLTHPKLMEIVHSNFYDLSAVESQLAGYNACFFCLGVSSVGMPAEEYYKVTYTLTMHVAETLSRLNPPPAARDIRIAPIDPAAAVTRFAPTDAATPTTSATTPVAPVEPVTSDTTVTHASPAGHATPPITSADPATRTAPITPGNMVFSYVSGAGTDSTEKGRSRWARVKGKTENDLMHLPFRRVYAFRPGFIKPTKGLRNAHAFYKYINWLFPLGRALYPAGFVTLSELGLSMIHLALHCDGDAIVSGKDIIRYAATETAATAAIAAATTSTAAGSAR